MNIDFAGRIVTPLTGGRRRPVPVSPLGRRQYNEADMTERTAYKLSEVREALNIGRSTMYRWIKEGKLEVTQLGGRSFVKREALKGLMDAYPSRYVGSNAGHREPK